MPHGKKRTTKDTLEILKSDGKAVLKKPARKRTQDCERAKPKQPTARCEDVGLPLLSALATVGSHPLWFQDWSCDLVPRRSKSCRGCFLTCLPHMHM